MNTFDFLGFFIGSMRVIPETPFTFRAELDEPEGKCRTARSRFWRILPGRAVVIGRWRKSGLTEAEMFVKLFKARNLDLFDEDGTIDPRYVRAARETIAENVEDPEDEWTILQMVGLE